MDDPQGGHGATCAFAYSTISMVSFRILVERDADPLFAAPDRVATAHELIGRDDQREGPRDAERIGKINACATGRDVSHGAVDAAPAAERDRAAFEDPVAGR